MSTQKPTLRQRVKAPVHPVTWAAVVLAAITLVGSIFNWWTGTPHPSRAQVTQAAAPVARHVARDVAATELRSAAAKVVGQFANAAPAGNESCTVPVGQGVMGACAPAATPTLGALARSSSVTRVYGLIGADTSSFQGCVAAPRWISFWIVKATEGTGYRDRCTATDVRIAKAQHQVYGTYDFMRATGSNAGAEAGAYVSYVRAAGASKGLHVLDVETNARGLAPATVHAYICDWVRRVHGALGGQVVIYTGNWFWGPRVGGSTCGAILWDSAYANYAQLPGTWGGGFLAAYGWAPYVGQKGRYRSSTPFWQYSDGVYGPVPRVNRWDTDAFFGSRAQLEQLAGLSSPCSKRTACRMGRRHAHVHTTIAKKCRPAGNRKRHAIVCRRLHNRNEYMHRYARRHHFKLVTS